MERVDLLDKVKKLLMDYEHVSQEEVQCTISFPVEVPWEMETHEYFGADGFTETKNGQLKAGEY